MSKETETKIDTGLEDPTESEHIRTCEGMAREA